LLQVEAQCDGKLCNLQLQGFNLAYVMCEDVVVTGSNIGKERKGNSDLALFSSANVVDDTCSLDIVWCRWCKYSRNCKSTPRLHSRVTMVISVM